MPTQKKIAQRILEKALILSEIPFIKNAKISYTPRANNRLLSKKFPFREYKIQVLFLVKHWVPRRTFKRSVRVNKPFSYISRGPTNVPRPIEKRIYIDFPPDHKPKTPNQFAKILGFIPCNQIYNKIMFISPADVKKSPQFLINQIKFKLGILQKSHAKLSTIHPQSTK